MIKILVTGDRNWTAPYHFKDDPDFNDKNNLWMSRRQTVREAIENLELDLEARLSNFLIIHGGAHGVDSLAGSLAEELGCQARAYPAQWDVYGRGAGPIRNREMLDKNPEVVQVLAFHDDVVGKSKGTLHMCRYARQKNVPVTVYRSDGSFFQFVMPASMYQFGRRK